MIHGIMITHQKICWPCMILATMPTAPLYPSIRPLINPCSVVVLGLIRVELTPSPCIFLLDPAGTHTASPSTMERHLTSPSSPNRCSIGSIGSLSWWSLVGLSPYTCAALPYPTWKRWQEPYYLTFPIHESCIYVFSSLHFSPMND